LPIPTNQ